MFISTPSLRWNLLSYARKSFKTLWAHQSAQEGLKEIPVVGVGMILSAEGVKHLQHRKEP